MPPLNDNTFPAGKIGFWTKSDAVSYFGDTTILYTPRVPMAQTLVQNMMQKYPRILELRIYTLNDKGNRNYCQQERKRNRRAGDRRRKRRHHQRRALFWIRHRHCRGDIPLTDRNGDSVAAVRVQLKSFTGETQDTAVARVRAIVKQMQAQVTSGEELTQ